MGRLYHLEMLSQTPSISFGNHRRGLSRGSKTFRQGEPATVQWSTTQAPYRHGRFTRLLSQVYRQQDPSAVAGQSTTSRFRFHRDGGLYGPSGRAKRREDHRVTLHASGHTILPGRNPTGHHRPPAVGTSHKPSPDPTMMDW